MSVLVLLVPVSLGLAALFVAACILSIRAGQFDDLESPRWRLLFDPADPAKSRRDKPSVRPTSPSPEPHS